MKRTLSMLAVAALGLTACTDQPMPTEPQETATVTDTVTAEPADNLATPERVAGSIAEILEEPTPADIPVGQEALADLQEAITMATDDACPIVAEATPEVAAYGAVDSQDEETQNVRGLGAFGFGSVEDAAAFTEHLQTVLQECETADYDVTPLTHHTDEAMEIRIETTEDPAASVVLLRNEYWVLTAVSTPAADVALSLTQLDQLDEMLR